MNRLTMLAVAFVAFLVVAPGCSHTRGLHSTKERNMTVGLVQKEIRVGMSGADVAAALGSPNIVTRDNQGRESWIYDKIATEASYSDSSGNVSGGLHATGVAGDTLLLGNVGAGASRAKGASATTQRTLTVIIRFDPNGMVETFTYHSSRF